ncbi:hypothetical protein BCR36DRAFT_315413 [Piromyces finnis]|uniref:Postreplication repair E3 ubiquitin-protein ligase RAD18 n=1 Tax=Piromyces finnis TaxID=1754191 RepID=A0A1Y1VP06_9FUNG|nr:hypothetical protein BCR36DRAFT_315413 [Piromyces finnis]|eukprot:ORX61126.1 hypothetical protein BCR36DRAFT_315413 [Piromyces finnis]
MFDFDLTDIYDFPEEYGSFRDFDNLLRCPICKEFLNPTLILTSCQHYGCSYCMRKTITEMNICPMCRHSADATELQKVSLIDDIIKIYKNNRKIILELIEFKKKNNNNRINNVLDTKQDSKIDNHKSELDSKDINLSDDGDTTMATIALSDISSQVGTNEKNDTFLNDNIEQNSNGDFNSKSVSNNGNNDNDNNDNNNNNNNVDIIDNNQSGNSSHEFSSIQPSDDEFVQCPLCLQNIQVKRLNRHMDLNCPKESPLNDPSNNSLNFFMSSSKSDNDSAWKNKIFSNPIVKPKIKNKTQKLRSLAYNLLTESKLRKILKDLKIPSHGDKILMQKRHAEYVNIFNANCDLDHPKSHQRLVEELKRWEKINFETSSPFSKHNSFPKSFFSSRHNNGHNISANSSGSSQNDIDLEEINKEHQSYLQSHKSDFDYLIKQIKKREKKKDSSEDKETSDKNEPEDLIDLDIFYDEHSHISFNSSKEKPIKNNKSIKNKVVRKKQSDSDDEYYEGSKPSKKARSHKTNVKTPTKRYNTRSSHITLDINDDKQNSEDFSNMKRNEEISNNNSSSHNTIEVYEVLSSENESTEKNKEMNYDTKEHKNDTNNNDNNHIVEIKEVQNNSIDNIDITKKVKESNHNNEEIENKSVEPPIVLSDEDVIMGDKIEQKE